MGPEKRTDQNKILELLKRGPESSRVRADVINMDPSPSHPTLLPAPLSRSQCSRIIKKNEKAFVGVQQMPVVVFPGYKLILVSNIFGDLSYFSIKNTVFITRATPYFLQRRKQISTFLFDKSLTLYLCSQIVVYTHVYNLNVFELSLYSLLGPVVAH